MRLFPRIAAIAALVALAGINGCATTNGKLALTNAQLQQLTSQVCITLNADLTLLEGPTGQTLLASNPNAMKKLTTVIGPDVALICASGATVDVTSLQTINSTILPALIDIVGAVPQIPDQAAILAALTAAQVILVPIVNQLIDTTQVPASSAPTTMNLDIPTQNKHFVLASVESPQMVGGAASLVLVSCLQGFKHVTVSAPTAAAITVLFTVGAAAIDNLIS